LGPVAVTPDEVPTDATVRCRVLRDGKSLFEGAVSIAEMHWSFDQIVAYASIYNPLPPGSVVMTGTAIVRPDAESLADGDVVEIEIDGIGLLRNRGRRLVSPVPEVPYR
jgi:2-dehydro-3-deoxy-D-arabinonate dehydratase